MNFLSLFSLTSDQPNVNVIARSDATKQSVATHRAKGHPQIGEASSYGLAEPAPQDRGFVSARSLLAMTVFGALVLSSRPARALEFPKYERVTKGNTTVLLMKQDRVPLVAIRVNLSLDAIPTGTRPTPADALLYANVIKYGSRKYPGEQWLKTLEGFGGELHVDADNDSIMLATEVRGVDATGALDLLLDGVQFPELSEDHVKVERERLVSESLGAADQPQALASRALDIAYFGFNHPYSEKISPTALRNAKAAGLVTNCTKLTVTLVGDINLNAPDLAQRIDEQSAWNAAQKAAWKTNIHMTPVECAPPLPPQIPPAAKLKSPRVILIDVPEAQQTQIRLMMPGPTDIYSPLQLATIPFGSTFTSRLVHKLRTELGLTYGIGARLEQRPLASTYSITSFTKVASTGEFLKVLFAEIGKARKDGLTAEEVAKGKALMLGEGPMRWERYSGLAAILERNALYGRPDDYPVAQITRAQGYDAKAANAALAAALAAKSYVLVLVGPIAKLKPIAAQYGAVEIWTKQQVVDPK